MHFQVAKLSLYLLDIEIIVNKSRLSPFCQALAFIKKSPTLTFFVAGITNKYFISCAVSKFTKTHL